MQYISFVTGSGILNIINVHNYYTAKSEFFFTAKYGETGKRNFFFSVAKYFFLIAKTKKFQTHHIPASRCGLDENYGKKTIRFMAK